MVAGNHDTPRTAETGCISGCSRRSASTSWTASRSGSRFPSTICRFSPCPTWRKTPPFEPDPHAKYNILLLHGEIEGVLPRSGRELDRRPMEITRTGARCRPLGLRRARPLSRVPADRAERVLRRIDRLHEHQLLGRADRGARLWRECRRTQTGPAGRESSSTISPTGAHTFHLDSAAAASGSISPALSGAGLSPLRSTRQFALRVESL